MAGKENNRPEEGVSSPLMSKAIAADGAGGEGAGGRGGRPGPHRGCLPEVRGEGQPIQR